MTLFDVTRDESVSALKYDLIKKDSLTNPGIVKQIQENLGAMLNIPRLKTGFISFDKGRELLQSIGFGVGSSIVLSDKKNIKRLEQLCCYNKKLNRERKIMKLLIYIYILSSICIVSR